MVEECGEAAGMALLVLDLRYRTFSVPGRKFMYSTRLHASQHFPMSHSEIHIAQLSNQVKSIRIKFESKYMGDRDAVGLNSSHRPTKKSCRCI